MSDAMDWEAIYKGQGFFEGPPPWNIGEPQPEIAALIRAGRFRGDVLDAGCGVGETSLELASQGHTIVGTDLAQTAIAVATKAAEQRGLANATFVQDDVTSFAGYDGRFNTVVDSGLLHCLPIEKRDDYLRAIHRAAAPGASLFILAFAAEAFPPDRELPGPHGFTEDELRQVVSSRWDIDEIRPAFIHAKVENDRQKMPAFLLTAHKSR